MSFLSVKTLRHYHEVDLLIPAAVDPSSGYRRYSTDQLSQAQVIVRLRGLGMPLDDIRQVLGSPDIDSRNAAISAHLQRMERRLEQTRDTVASLRRILEDSPGDAPVEHRHIDSRWTLAISTQTTIGTVAGWLDEARLRLVAALQSSDLERTGPDGSLYYEELFTEAGIRELDDATTAEIIAYLPVDRQPTSDQLEAFQPELGGFGDVVARRLPEVDLAVLTHRGSCHDLDRSYARLGGYVTGNAIGISGPIREHHLDPVDTPTDDLRTEIGWPIFPVG
jgi:DNA-binding transcriptional MerR regulator/effector-binding domain-containing protein